MSLGNRLLYIAPDCGLCFRDSQRIALPFPAAPRFAPLNSFSPFFSVFLFHGARLPDSTACDLLARAGRNDQVEWEAPFFKKIHSSFELPFRTFFIPLPPPPRVYSPLLLRRYQIFCPIKMDVKTLSYIIEFPATNAEFLLSKDFFFPRSSSESTFPLSVMVEIFGI